MTEIPTRNRDNRHSRVRWRAASERWSRNNRSYFFFRVLDQFQYVSGDGIEVDDCVDELLGESFAPEPLDPLGSHNDTDIQ